MTSSGDSSTSSYTRPKQISESRHQRQDNMVSVKFGREICTGHSRYGAMRSVSTGQGIADTQPCAR
eukprot:3693744-Rhodomonas_salina.1